MTENTSISKSLDRTEKTPIASYILELMNEVGIRESELARQTGLPQTTINRLLLGDTADPRANTLKPIAKYFGVTVGQLLGVEPRNLDRVKGTHNTFNREVWTNIPIIDWDKVISWSFTSQQYTFLTHGDWIITERMIGANSFALLSKPFMEPRFKKNATLIIDPLANYEDGKFVIVSFDNRSVTVRQLVFDGAITYLKSIDASLPSVIYDKKDARIYGVIVEARMKV